MKAELNFVDQGLKGQIEVPGDKSISHRAVMLGSIAEGVTTIENFLDAGDPWSTVNCMKNLGVVIEGEKNSLQIYGKDLYGLQEPENILDAGNSGTTIRLLSGILAGQNFFSVITGDKSLRKRPMDRIADPLRKMGANINGRAGGRYAPLAIEGGKLQGTEHKLTIASAQVKSAILLAGLLAENLTVVVEPDNSRDHTERMLEEMGCCLKKEDKMVTLEGNHSLKPLSIKVPGDFSSAAFFIAAASIAENSELLITNVGINPTRTGFLTALQEMNADIAVLNERKSGGEPVADLLVTSSNLEGIEIGGEIIPSLIDEVPVLAVVAAVSKGKTIIRDAAELKVKESNRLNTIASELNKMGAEVTELPDGLEIKGKKALQGAACESHNDHRIAMALAVASFKANEVVTVDSWDCVDISFPTFLSQLKSCAFKK